MMSSVSHSRNLRSRGSEMKENEQPETQACHLTAAEMSSKADNTVNNDAAEDYEVEEEQEESWEWNGPNFVDLDRDEEEIYSDFQNDRTGGGVLSLSNRELENLSASYLASSQHKRDLLMFDDHDEEDDETEEGEFANGDNARPENQDEQQAETAAAEVGSDDEEELMFTDDMETMTMSATSRKTDVHEDEENQANLDSSENDSFRTAPGGPALGDTDDWKKKIAAKELHSNDLQVQDNATSEKSSKKEKEDIGSQSASDLHGRGPSYMRATMATSGRARQKYSGINSQGPSQRETMNATTKSHKPRQESTDAHQECQDLNKSQPANHKPHASKHFAAPTASSSAPKQEGFETMASGVHKFFSEIPSRYHSNARNSKQNMTKAEKRKLTIPVSPHLHYEERAKTREQSHSHTHQKAEADSEHAKPFKARPWNKQAFSSVKLPERAARRPPTVPQSPNCTHHQHHSHVHHGRTDENVEETQHKTFKARPMPKYPTTTDQRTRSRDSSHPLTTPESPMLSTKHRAVARPPAPPGETASKAPAEHTHKKVSRPPTIPETTQFHSANHPVTRTKNPRPRPGHSGNRNETEVKPPAQNEQPTTEAKTHHFKARPVPKAVKEQTKAFKPVKSNKPPTRVASVCLHTDKRTEARRAFEERNKARLRELELQKQKEQEEKRREEEEEIRRLRREKLVFKARPARINQQQTSHQNEERKNSLTIPETPPLHTEEKARKHKGEEIDEENAPRRHQGKPAGWGIQTRRMTKGNQLTETTETEAVPTL
eukprot:gb/GECG01006976.1/.p1 GENE.gb/GECG01006976.1/~~gb/GECG01006976.1/.p1  ORF type:complete len:776 (+),score=145.29 gb/GECG01006976.1/:1-2328(+)